MMYLNSYSIKYKKTKLDKKDKEKSPIQPG
jgi:hypothetical protein